jgi:hypothetical protein
VPCHGAQAKDQPGRIRLLVRAPIARQSCARSSGFQRSPADGPSPSLPFPSTKKAPAKRRFLAV